jgi:hypothetical protein
MLNSKINSTNQINEEFIYFPQAVGARYFTETFFFHLGTVAHRSNWLHNQSAAVRHFFNRKFREFNRKFREIVNQNWGWEPELM